jgi:hypothetical protein
VSSELDTCKLCGGRPYAPVTASWTFLVDRDAPSQNTMGGNKGGGRWRYKTERKGWVYVLQNWKLSLRIGDAAVRRRVSITRCYSGQQKERDHGNLVGGLKAAVDAMVIVGLLRDDKPKWAEIHYHQRRVEKSERGTVITVEELA